MSPASHVGSCTTGTKPNHSSHIFKLGSAALFARRYYYFFSHNYILLQILLSITFSYGILSIKGNHAASCERAGTARFGLFGT